MNLFPESGGQATGLCPTQYQLPPRRLYRLTDGVGNCIRNAYPRLNPPRLDSDYRHVLGTFAQQRRRLE